MLLGFELAQTDARFVGLNLVMPEDWPVPMRDFDLHMKMLDYLHGLYPKVHISLHAGELAMGLVSPEGLRFHIRDSVKLGHAERIGHGVDITYEDERDKLLKKMADDKILVEICLTSNDGILGVRGAQHPLKLYLDNNVPVALATDDEGVSRSDMTNEYLRAAQTYDFLGYNDLKRMARMSLEHSFLPGDSVWADTQQFHSVPACASDHAGMAKISPDCQKFLDSNERAREQWKLEGEFAKFESRF
jgi:adenosine deaminase